MTACTRGVESCTRAVYGGLVFVETCHSHTADGVRVERVGKRGGNRRMRVAA